MLVKKIIFNVNAPPPHVSHALSPMYECMYLCIKWNVKEVVLPIHWVKRFMVVSASGIDSKNGFKY